MGRLSTCFLPTSGHAIVSKQSRSTQPRYEGRRRLLITASTPAPSPRLLSFLERAEEGNPVIGLQRAEAAFARIKTEGSAVPPSTAFVSAASFPVRLSASEATHYDVAIAGGTLGIFYATALARLGWRVVVLERGPVAGRKQEWNTSRSELATLVSNGVMLRKQLESAIVTEFPEGRIGFARRDGGQHELMASGVLNVGVAPDILVSHACENFKALGGEVFEYCSLRHVEVGEDAVRLHIGDSRVAVPGALGAGGTGLLAESKEEGGRSVTARVLIDAMGAFSPIAAQARGYRRPDAICITVGSCMKGPWKANESGDLIYSFQPINKMRSVQYFWEAFPVGREVDARTTYMFAYGPCEEGRQSLTEALEDYVETVPDYQGIDVNDMHVKRVLFGFFPSYFRDCPTRVAFDRVLSVGDAGGLQSPISFGGFGCCLRHLNRITMALNEALKQDSDVLLRKSSLQSMQWYLPSLSVTGLFHTAMSVRPGQSTAGPLLDEYGINEVLWSNMRAMKDLGEDVQRPFLQDVVTAGGLSQTLAAMTLSNPGLAIRMTAFLGPSEIVEWSRHYLSLLLYAGALPLLRILKDIENRFRILTAQQRFLLNRLVDAATYGSGKDVEES